MSGESKSKKDSEWGECVCVNVCVCVCVYETESIRPAPLNLLSSEAIVLCSTSLY